ncbi:TPA: hypothetical protein ACH3X1_002888 [Trebouxia sp. C0004]
MSHLVSSSSGLLSGNVHWFAQGALWQSGSAIDGCHCYSYQRSLTEGHCKEMHLDVDFCVQPATSCAMQHVMHMELDVMTASESTTTCQVDRKPDCCLQTKGITAVS